MIEFFTPWCMYCQQMMGEWNRVSRDYVTKIDILSVSLMFLLFLQLFSYYEEQPETRKDVKICKMNCDDHK